MVTAAADLQALSRTVTAARQGDRPAADQLVRENDPWIRSVIYGVTGRADQVDDIAQQVWAQVWERFDSLQDPARLRSWLCAIARNAAIDAGLARKRDLRGGEVHEGIADPRTARETGGAQNRAIGSETEQLLLRAIEALPALYREPFVLRHLEDWSYAEIGEVLGLPVDTVETRLVRARRLLREMLAGKI
jgi:RNA polymerase sigma factor (sigma-70 family)